MRVYSFVKMITTKDMILSFIGLIIAIANGIIKSEILTGIFYTLEIGIYIDLILLLIRTYCLRNIIRKCNDEKR